MDELHCCDKREGTSFLSHSKASVFFCFTYETKKKTTLTPPYFCVAKNGVFVSIMKKDEIVVPGYYAYLLRVDYLHHTQDEIIKMLEYFIDEEKIEAFHIYEEVASKSKKIHIQAIVWSDRIYTPKMSQQVKRKYFKTIYDKSTRAIAFTDARKPQNLASYSMKDMNEIMSNLDEEDLAKIPRWKNIKEYKDKEFKDNLKIKMKEMEAYDIQSFMMEVTKIHWDNERAQPARHTMIKYLGIYNKHYTVEDYVDSLGITHKQAKYNYI